MLVTLFLGALIVLKFVDVVYRDLIFKLTHPEASSVGSLFRIIGIVALVVAVVGSNVSPPRKRRSADPRHWLWA
jgi:Kef-type K+ transport system membrane component KefB